MMESIEKLRELAADMNCMEIIDHLDEPGKFMFHTEWLDSWHKAFDVACDRIEREIAERYMELPLDEDGVDYPQLRIANLLAQRGKLQADLNTCELDNEHLRAENREMCDEIDSLTARRSELESENRELQNANDELQKRMLSIEDEVISLESERDEIIDDYNTMLRRANEAESERDELRVKLAIAEAEAKRTDDGWMRLPVDMNGEAIYVGDVLESDAFGRIEVEGFVHDAVAFWSYDPQPARLATCPCNLTRHVKERTVEDVLEEFADEVRRCCDSKEMLSRYAAEIRELIGDDA